MKISLLICRDNCDSQRFTGQVALARVRLLATGRDADRYTRQHNPYGQRLRQGHCAVDPEKSLRSGSFS